MSTKSKKIGRGCQNVYFKILEICERREKTALHSFMQRFYQASLCHVMFRSYICSWSFVQKCFSVKQMCIIKQCFKSSVIWLICSKWYFPDCIHYPRIPLETNAANVNHSRRDVLWCFLPFFVAIRHYCAIWCRQCIWCPLNHDIMCILLHSWYTHPEVKVLSWVPCKHWKNNV